MQSSPNVLLMVAAISSGCAALLHFACVFLGAPGFRILGAGERLVRMATRGNSYPFIVAVLIGIMLVIWSLYALSGAGAIPRLPFVNVVLVAITAVYLLRSVAFPLLKRVIPGNSDQFWYLSSLISLAIGLLHLFGLIQVWQTL
ncbi:hypothetical protein [Amphritea sp.]|uniref:hypothetical protein n=1 Tax=Amphritea sp. TaxID=1872502 RepID=UPI003D0FC8A6